MPFERIDPVSGFVGTKALPEPEEQESPDFVNEVIPAAFRTENIIGSYFSDTSRAFNDAPFNQDLDVWGEIAGTKYEAFEEDFAEVRNRAHLDAVKIDIDRELEDRATIAQAGATGYAAAMGAGFFDLPTLLPGGVALRTAKGGISVLKTAGITAGAGALEAGVSEVALRATQETRQPMETGVAIAGSAVLAGVLGTGIAASLKRSDAASIAEKIERDFVVPGDDEADVFMPGPVRGPIDEAATREFNPETDQLPLPEGRQIPRGIETTLNFEGEPTLVRLAQTEIVEPKRADFESDVDYQKAKKVFDEAISERDEARKFLEDLNEELQETGFVPSGRGAAVGAATANAAENTLKGALGFEKAFAFQDPLLRVQVRGGDPSKTIMQEMAETPLVYTKNAEGFETAPGGSQMGAPGSVESRVRLWQWPLSNSLKSVDDLFVEYRTGGPNRPGKRMSIALQDQMGTPSDLTYTEFKHQVARAMRRGDEHEIPQVAKAAKELRKNIFDPLKDEAVNAGLLPEGVEVDTALSYLMRAYNHEKIIRQRPEFKNRIVSWLKKERDEAEPESDTALRTDQDLEERADEIIDRILGTPDGRLPYDAHLDEGRLGGKRKRDSKRGPLRAREFNIPDEMIEDFLEGDIEYLARTYVRTVAPDVELTKRFGSVDMTDQMKEVSEWFNARIAKAKTDKDRKALQDQKSADIRDIAAVRDRLRHTYGLPEDPQNLAFRAGRVIRSLNYLRLLGGMTISAIPDISRLVMVHGLSNTFRDGLVPLFKGFANTRLAAHEVKAAGTALDMVLDTRAMQLADVMDDYGRLSKFERHVQTATQKFGMVSLMAPWNAALKQFSGLITMTRMLRAIERVERGTASKKEVEMLAAGGISETNARRIAKQFAKHGEKRDGVYLPNTRDWDEGTREEMEAFRTALARDVDRTIVTPGQGDRPLFMSRPMGQMLLQFKSFAIASMQRTLIAGLQQRDMGVLNGALLAVALGGMVHTMKQRLRDQPVATDFDDPDQFAQFLVNAVDRSGLHGWIMDANNMTEKITRGGIGLSRLTGKPVARYAHRNLTGALIGPTAGTIEDMARITGAATTGDVNATDVRALRRLMPYQNLFYLRQIFDTAEENIQSQLGLEFSGQ